MTPKYFISRKIDKQDKLVDEIIERLNEYGKKKSIPLLIDLMENTVARSLNASNKYMFGYNYYC